MYSGLTPADPCANAADSPSSAGTLAGSGAHVSRLCGLLRMLLQGVGMRHVARIAALIVLAAATAEAQELAGTFDQLRVLVKPGDTLTVVNDSGQRVEGKVSSVSASALSLTVSGTPRQFLSTEVNTIERRGPDSLKNGALIGLAIGGGIGGAGMIALAATAEDNVAGFMAVGVLMYAGIGAGIGTGFDALIEGRRVIYARSASARALTIAPLLGRSRKGVRVALRF